MKILKYGDGYPKTIVCERCKSELQYVIPDIESYRTKQEYKDKNLRAITTHSYIKCPVCGNTVIISEHTGYQSINQDALFVGKRKKWWKNEETF